MSKFPTFCEMCVGDVEIQLISWLRFCFQVWFGIKMAYEDNFQQSSEAKYDCLLFGKIKEEFLGLGFEY